MTHRNISWPYHDELQIRIKYREQRLIENQIKRFLRLGGKVTQIASDIAESSKPVRAATGLENLGIRG